MEKGEGESVRISGDQFVLATASLYSDPAPGAPTPLPALRPRSLRSDPALCAPTPLSAL
ncbi:hypothetical protein GCM10009599_08730 [Luteococcus peritonei]